MLTIAETGVLINGRWGAAFAFVSISGTLALAFVLTLRLLLRLHQPKLFDVTMTTNPRQMVLMLVVVIVVTG
jgi:hypothetical protein